MTIGQPAAGDGDSHAVVTIIEFAKTPEVPATSGLDQFRIGVFQRSASVFAVCVPPATQPVSVPSAEKCARTDEDFDEIQGINDPELLGGWIPIQPNLVHSGTQEQKRVAAVVVPASPGVSTSLQFVRARERHGGLGRLMAG
jgi:hypothetical protein